ncbi:hypothetical protein NHX12_007239 [Muraenolepis orangiensis]|uniref:Uncharacterized protein n=1 Tax=Muraenolepis orangiensis TaxID=630683 RepID=A0A9Q0DNR7_9TELE|nr:hypothetical protein NHX12_007239 [Muraenolepis orangiensis]
MSGDDRGTTTGKDEGGVGVAQQSIPFCHFTLTPPLDTPGCLPGHTPRVTLQHPAAPWSVWGLPDTPTTCFSSSLSHRSLVPSSLMFLLLRLSDD